MSEGVLGILLVPAVLFMVVVAPIWLVMHYRSKRRGQAALSSDERAELEKLEDLAERMRERIETLEAILDAQTPDWRKRDATS
jgi:phage shock protein B